MMKIYSTPTCPYCHTLKAFLKEKGIEFKDIDVSSDSAAAEEMIQKSGQMAVPVIVIGPDIVVGFNQARIDELLAK